MDEEFVILLLIVYGFILFQRFRTPACYNKSVGYFKLVSDSSLFWITFAVCGHSFLDNYENIDSTGLIYTFLGIFIFGGICIMLIE